MAWQDIVGEFNSAVGHVADRSTLQLVRSNTEAGGIDSVVSQMVDDTNWTFVRCIAGTGTLLSQARLCL